MKPIKKSPQFLKQRRYMTLLPLLVMPFVTILFMLLGGGKSSHANASPLQAGLNRSLPQAKLEHKDLADKLGYYERAAKDSASAAEQMKYEPYLNQSAGKADQQLAKASDLDVPIPTGNSGRYHDPVEEKIYRKLHQLNQVITQEAPAMEKTSPGTEPEESVKEAAVTSNDLDRLQHMMQQMQDSESADPELTQLQAMLEKIQEIQHPEILSQRLAASPHNPPQPVIYQTIPAVIAKNQKITQGTVVELRLLDSARLNGRLIPKGHQVYGIAELSNQRMELHIKNIGMGNTIIPVDLTVFDQRDSMEGIYVPEALTGEAIRDGADNALQGMKVLSMDQTAGTQLAGAGITAAKGLFSKKVRLLKGKISAGYPVLLKNNQN